MFFAVYKNNWITCAKGYIVRVSYQHPYKRTTKLWRHKAVPKIVRTEVRWIQKLKSKISALDPWSNLMHVNVDRSTFKSAILTGFKDCKEPLFTATALPTPSASIAPDRSDRFNLPAVGVCFSYTASMLGVFGVHVPTTGLVTPRGCRPFCSSSGHGKSERELDSKGITRAQGDAPRTPKEEPFQFKELYENPWTVPNMLCVARIALAPVLGYLIVEKYFHFSLGLFAFAGATDLLDGYIARNWANQKSALGSALDPLADKILISVLYISLTYAHLIPVPLTVLVISRDIALIAAVFYVRYKTVPPPVTLSKFFNPCYTTAQLKPTLISKVNTAVQLFLVAVSLASPVFHYTESVYLPFLWWATALTTTASGYSYYHYGKKTVEVLNPPK